MKCKRFLIPLILVLLLTCITPVYASETSSNNGVAVTNGTGAPGTEVHLKVSTRSAMADYVGLVIQYDPEQLTLVEGSGWLIEGELSDVKLDGGAAVWAGDIQEIKGDVFELVFRINENAKLDQVFSVTCTLLAKRGEEIELEKTATAAITVKNLAKISGTITSYGNANAPVTVELVKSDAVVDTKTLENGVTAYEFEVEQGEYIIRVKKTKHCPREYEVSMTELEDKVQDAEIRLYGDVTGDGMIKTADARQILKYFNGNDSVISDTDAYIMKVADVTGDGIIKTADARQILKYFNGNDSVFDTFE